MFLQNSLESILYMIPALLFAISIHECSHATIAYYLGDRYQKISGRMSLDPIKHFDMFGFISILLIGFGWGKPVMVDDSNFKNRDRDNMLVSLAGPISNLLMAVIFAIILKVLSMFGIYNEILYNLLIISIQFNVVFCVFNLIPLPPFDGSKILRYFLPYNLKYKYDGLKQYTFIIILFIAFTGIAGYIISPFVNGILTIIENVILS